MVVKESVSIESLILANHVEAVNGLLYISGGGWTFHNRPVVPGGPPPTTHLGIALVIAVPWNETNRLHNITLEIRDDDAKDVVLSVNAQLNVGRLPMVKPGTIQYPSIALPMNITFPHAGDYEIIARINGEEVQEKRWRFAVNDIMQANAVA